MEKVTIYKNKGETFKCHFKIEGAEVKDTIIRLCLEFQDNPNYFFYGELKEDGECVIEIPRLKNIDEKTGKLVVEAIADSVYFKVFEAEAEFKNSVEVSMESPSIKKASPTKVKMEGFAQNKVQKKKEKAPEPIVEEKKPEKKVNPGDNINYEFEMPKPKNAEPVEEPKKKPMTSFTEYLKANK